MPSYDLPNGMVLAGKYRITGTLGQGGMGSVYEAVNDAIDRRVALKLLDASLAAHPEFARRFELEAKAAAVIGHRGIVDVLDMGRTDEGVPFIVMEHLQGVTLRTLQRRLQQLTATQASAVIAPVLDALAAAHAAGVTHRDLKPANIFIAVRPVEEVKILDFGISKFHARGGGMTQTGTTLGTPAYMAPEQLRDGRNVGPHSDLYAVGAMLYTLLTGHPPFEADSDFALVALVLTEPHRPTLLARPDLPVGLAALVDQLLSKDAAQRPGSAREAQQLLLQAAPPEPRSVFARAAEFAPPQRAVSSPELPLKATPAGPSPDAGSPTTPARRGVAPGPSHQLPTRTVEPAPDAASPPSRLTVAVPRRATRAATFFGGYALVAAVVAVALTPVLLRAYNGNAFLQSFALLLPGLLGCAWLARAQRPSPVARVEAWAWSTSLIGYLLVALGFAALGLIKIWAPRESTAADTASLLLLLPGLLFGSVGSAVLGVALLKAGYRPWLTAALLLPVAPLVIAALATDQKAIGAVVTLAVAWAPTGWGSWRPGRSGVRPWALLTAACVALFVPLALLVVRGPGSAMADQPPPAAPSAGARESAPFAEELRHARELNSDGKPLEGLALLDEALARAEAGTDPGAVAHALRNRGNYAQDLERCSEAEVYFRRSVEAFEKLKDKAGIGLVANDIGLLGNMCEGIDRVTWFQRAVDSRWAARDVRGVRLSANNLGTAHFNAGDLERSDQAFNQALIAATDLADFGAMAKIRANLALVWCLMAEGGFALPETPPGPVDVESPAWQRARMHYTQGVAAAGRAGQAEDVICAAFGQYEPRCQRLRK